MYWLWFFFIYRIGLCGFDNPMRDSKTEEIKRHVGHVSINFKDIFIPLSLSLYWVRLGYAVISEVSKSCSWRVLSAGLLTHVYLWVVTGVSRSVQCLYQQGQVIQKEKPFHRLLDYEAESTYLYGTLLRVCHNILSELSRFNIVNNNGQKRFCPMRKNLCFWRIFGRWIQICFQNFSIAHNFRSRLTLRLPD